VAVCAVKREQREHPFYHKFNRAFTKQIVSGKDPVAALVANHEEGIQVVGERIAALQSGGAVIIEVPERIGKRGTPTNTVFVRGGTYNW
jgi:hypothetical protein